MFVCLGWGSLIWQQGDLPVKGALQIGGPVLPLEFARLSLDGRITLVVCEQGTPAETVWIELAVSDLDEARTVLAAREGLPSSRNAAFWTPSRQSDHYGADNVAAWASERKLTGVVWTGLPPKSPASRTNGDFPSGDVVLDHLKGLQGDARVKAEEYVRRAPKQIRTAYRDIIEKELGWLPQA